MDNLDFSRFIFAFIFVIGLIGVSAMLLKRYAVGNKWMGVAQEGDRIQIVQTRYLDPRRKLMLIKRDDKEHLLLLADGRELIIESGIPAAGESKNA